MRNRALATSGTPLSMINKTFRVVSVVFIFAIMLTTIEVTYSVTAKPAAAADCPSADLLYYAPLSKCCPLKAGGTDGIDTTKCVDAVASGTTTTTAPGGGNQTEGQTTSCPAGYTYVGSSSCCPNDNVQNGTCSNANSNGTTDEPNSAEQASANGACDVLKSTKPSTVNSDNAEAADRQLDAILEGAGCVTTGGPNNPAHANLASACNGLTSVRDQLLSDVGQANSGAVDSNVYIYYEKDPAKAQAWADQLSGAITTYCDQGVKPVAGTQNVKLLINGLIYFGLIMCVLAMFIAAGLWAMGSKTQNTGQELTGKRGFGIALLAAFFIGAMPGIMGFISEQSKAADTNGITTSHNTGAGNGTCTVQQSQQGAC